MVFVLFEDKDSSLNGFPKVVSSKRTKRVPMNYTHLQSQLSANFTKPYPMFIPSEALSSMASWRGDCGSSSTRGPP